MWSKDKIDAINSIKEAPKNIAYLSISLMTLPASLVPTKEMQKNIFRLAI